MKPKKYQQTIDKVGVVFFVSFDIIAEFKMAFVKTMFCVFLFLQVLTGAWRGQAEGNKLLFTLMRSLSNVFTIDHSTVFWRVLDLG